ncbi:MAG: pyridoxamine kinase [Clostridia bacterium]|nr:pyridoxamine kinase [Clostridia bacterium]
MQDTPKILSVQDISCYGQCSNTVMLPMLSAAGLEVVALPTALLSTHTGGFTGYTFLDLTEEMKKILAHLKALSLRFSYLATGYFGSAEQIDTLLAALPYLMAEDGLRIIDPVMGDHGSLYSIYDMDFAKAMRRLCAGADVITPNLTEACLLADLPYEGPHYDEGRMALLFDRLAALGVKNAVVTGVMFDGATIGVVAREEDQPTFCVRSPYVDRRFHGTGDTLTAALISHLVNGLPFRAAVEGAVRFVSNCIADTVPVMDTHWYGLCFEGRLSEITALHK